MSCGVMLCVRRDERDAAQAAVIPEIVQLGDVAVFAEAADVASVPLLQGSEPGSEEEDADPERVVRDDVPHCEKRSLLRHASRVGDQRRKVVKAPMKPTKTILRIFGSRSIRRSASASSSP